MQNRPVPVSPPRGHPKRAHDSDIRPYSGMWVYAVTLLFGEDDTVGQTVDIHHCPQYHLLDSARANAARLGLSERYVDGIAEIISELMMPCVARTLEEDKAISKMEEKVEEVGKQDPEEDQAEMGMSGMCFPFPD